MIHVITLHYATPAWLEIQKTHFLKFVDEKDYKLWLGISNITLPTDFELPKNWEVVEVDNSYPSELENEHYLYIQWMFHTRIKQHMADDDILVFIDSDAFPCTYGYASNLNNNLDSKSSIDGVRTDVMCVIMPENRGMATLDHYEESPDLCFFASTKKVYEENNLAWGLFKPLHQNPGFGMKDRIVEANMQVGGLRRTNAFNAHNVMFGIYGGLIYHHGCGSRALVGRPKPTRKGKVNNTRQCYTGADVFRRFGIADWFEKDFETECSDLIETNTQIFDIIYEKLKHDKDASFVRRYFMGIGSEPTAGEVWDTPGK